MTSIRTNGARFGFAWLGATLLLAAGGAQAHRAQPVQPGTYQPAQPAPDDPLARELSAVAENPHDAGALMSAGRTALAMGDARAALTFFGRAEEILPTDGRIKLAMGSALVQLEEPAAALKFFRDAVGLGVPDAEVAGDRGLAYDISGDPRHAQRDYRLALARNADPEITRRLALSLAISGEREAALQVLDAQLRRRDRAAERTWALVLALSGDDAGAARLVEAEMPGPQGVAIQSYLVRLAGLSAKDKALAVNLGHFPDASHAPAAPVYARNEVASRPVALPPSYQPSTPLTDAGKPDSSRPALGRPNVPASNAPWRNGPASNAPWRNGPAQAPVRTASATPTPVRSQAATTTSRPPAAAPAKPVRTASRSEPASPPMTMWQWARGELPPVPRETESKPVRQAPAPVRTAAVARPQPAVSQPPVSRPLVSQPTTRPVEVARNEPVSLVPPRLTEAAAQAPAENEPAPVMVMREEPAAAPPQQIAQQPASLLPADMRPNAHPVEIARTELPPSVIQPAFQAPPVEHPMAPAVHPAAVVAHPASAAQRPAARPAQGRLADVAADLDQVSDTPASRHRGTQLADARGSRAAAHDAPDKPAHVARKPEAPSRHWVQLAHGGSSNLGSVYGKLKDKAPRLLGSRDPWIARGSPNRLVVGPFASEKAAQNFADRLTSADLEALAWTSDAGQRVEKIDDE